MSQVYRFVSKIENIPLEITYNHLYRLEMALADAVPEIKESLRQVTLRAIIDSPLPREVLKDLKQWTWQADMSSSDRTTMLIRLVKIEEGFVELGQQHVPNFEDVAAAIQIKVDEEREYVKVFTYLDTLISEYQHTIQLGGKIPDVARRAVGIKNFLSGIDFGELL